MGDLEIDQIEIPLCDIIPTLTDQKYKNMVYVSHHEAAFDVIFRLRYDEVILNESIISDVDLRKDYRDSTQNAED